ncbi:Clan CA, family C19, ubiquitin hydrolase-like cysteine peptidase [Trichomonas vaginalis G3]|uniref:Clan CA, family C19, ubiquitin hydrolase-like cysteine peptidase n=1 Tax=Trichomonas vaginalis (strain ATCC PRA-98 / G3) TaxID=412133 RepID=A2F7B9_TRIV3|nr:ubiquitinyl hydrolase protein [Trichomonas vaginalis G3]EAX99187.1 Clan CA, family C19, ubiquitin hydrolase-like cysteine peptidase [Trichomonas vaginalis G3]KAI5487974.1 ubiquitinyl hydrolase protein [Trichomonas vaginalis G3]|eukprot:XP_001312117.1 Clan CA, family C19, ubiquitin hydrolase-like cysteine peptidase [Trichomonas vaginalis G3]
MSELSLSYLVDPAEVEKQARSMLRAKKDLFTRLNASHQPQLVALVEAEWFKSFVFWLNSPDIDYPGPIPNHKLCKNGKLENSKQFGVDYAVVTLDGWNILIKVFQGGPKITRNYVLNPKSNKPTILIDQIPIEIEFQGKTFRKHVEGNWKVGPIKKLLCKKLDIPNQDYTLFDPSCQEEISNSSKISEVITTKAGLWHLVITEEATKRPPQIIKMENHKTSTFHSLSYDVGFGHICLPVLCLYSLHKVRELMFDPELPKFINKSDPTSSGGRTTALVRKIFRDLAKPTDERVSFDAFVNFVYRRFEEFALTSDVRFAEHGVSLIINALHKDLLHEEDSKISDLLFVETHGSLECESCHQFTDFGEFVDMLTVPIPKQTDDTRLEDCIASFALPTEYSGADKMKCPKCGKLSNMTKFQTVQSARDVMIINLQRVTVEGILENKNTTFVRFPFELKSAAFVSTTDAVYCLTAVIFHQGDVESGQYKAAIRLPDDSWIYADNTATVVINKNEIVNPDASILFYEKI